MAARRTGPGVSRATRQRQVAASLRRGESPLGGKYREIVRKATERSVRAKAQKHFHDLLHEYWRYNDDTVREGCREVMTLDQARWTITADTDEIRDRATHQHAGPGSYVIIWNGRERNPWWYH
jgi:hypothetical protein